MAVLYSCSSPNSLPYYNTSILTPLWADEQPILTDTLHRIAKFSFTNQDGATITNDTFRNKVYVANFFFTICPGICPKLTANLKLVANEFTNNPHVKFISHSVTPGIDSVQRLKQYAVDHHINSDQWHLVTGDKKMIYDLARYSYFAEEDQGFQQVKNDFLHTEHFMLIDSEGHLRGIYKGTLGPDMIRLKDDINVLLSEL